MEVWWPKARLEKGLAQWNHGSKPARSLVMKDVETLLSPLYS